MTKAPDILLKIAEQRRRRLGAAAPGAYDPERPEPGGPEETGIRGPFTEALEARRGRAGIAEIKMGSPSLGRLGGEVRPVDRARSYAAGGAAALSVVVEPDFFYGSYELLAECKAACGLAAVAKDFVVHPLQVERAADAGADAVLLIAALYGPEELQAWARLVRAHGLTPLVETHGADDIAKLGDRGWELLGVNNRDLRTFEVDLEHSIAQVKRLPAGALKVAESGIRSRRDAERLAAAGFDAFLVGETLLRAEDPEAMVRELAGGGA